LLVGATLNENGARLVARIFRAALWHSSARSVELGIAWRRYMEYELEAGDPIKGLDFSDPALGATFRW